MAVEIGGEQQGTYDKLVSLLTSAQGDLDHAYVMFDQLPPDMDGWDETCRAAVMTGEALALVQGAGDGAGKGAPSE